MDVIERLNERLSYALHKMRENKRQNYWYQKALKHKQFYLDWYPEQTEAINKEWNECWHRKFMQAQR